MSRETKQQFVEQMRRDMDRAEGVLFLDYTGLTVSEADVLRRKLSAAKITYKVVKNTLMTRALEGSAYSDVVQCLKGTPTGVVMGWEDPVTPAKLTFEFLKECEHIKIKGGVVDNRAIKAPEAEALSKMPSREELHSMIVGQAMSPGRNLAGQIKSPAGRILGAIEALVDKQEA